MNSKLILWLFLPILLLCSCYKPTEWEDVTADYDPVLNVMGIISLDGNIESFVEVYPTIDLMSVSTIIMGYDSTFLLGKGEDGSGYWDIKAIRKPANIIDTATVIVFTEADTFLFNFDGNDGKYKNSDFHPQQEIHYSLSVEVNGFDSVTGDLTTPSIPDIDSSLRDTLFSSSTYTINWENNQASAELGILMGELEDSDVMCGGEFDEVVELTSEKYTVFPQWCDPEEIEIGDIDNDGDGNPDYETLQIRFMVMDDNYYQYFARERFKDFSNFLFETNGTSGQSIGIKGGFGVFGAFASDTLTRVLSP